MESLDDEHTKDGLDDGGSIAGSSVNKDPWTMSLVDDDQLFRIKAKAAKSDEGQRREAAERGPGDATMDFDPFPSLVSKTRRRSSTTSNAINA